MLFIITFQIVLLLYSYKRCHISK